MVREKPGLAREKRKNQCDRICGGVDGRNRMDVSGEKCPLICPWLVISPNSGQQTFVIGSE